ncbi:MAG: glycosyltransferase [Lachnospiraceae bacterium]|nr:glycosyltransferase [Lachnospiraceae bacterium]
MHVAMYIGSLTKGGAERVMVNLAKDLLAHGDEVTFVTTFLEEDEFPVPEGARRVISGLTEDEMTWGRVRNIARRRNKLRDIWKDLDPDLILSFIGKNNVMAIQTARGLSIPVVVSVRGNPSQEYENAALRFAMRATFPYADGVIVQTEGAKNYFSEIVKKKCTVLKNPVAQEFLSQPLSRARKKEMVVVGRIDDNKNQILAVKAFAQTFAAFPDWKMTLYGEGEGSFRIENLIRDLGQASRICLAGNVEDVAQRIKDASIYVLPSREEGMPNALLEAMALGLACISTDCPVGAAREILQEGRRGFLVPVDNVDGMRGAMIRLMGDEALRKELGEAALAVRNEYEPGAVCSAWRDYFKEVTGAI